MKSGHPVVDAIGELHFEGNIIPHSWYQCADLKHSDGKPYYVAIVLLADLVYWYRPTVERDEYTNQVVAVRKKFAADKVFKDYETWGASFGFTKRQVRDAVGHLVEKRLITRELRDGPLNRPYLEPVPERIKEITFGAGSLTLKRQSPAGGTSGASRSGGKRQAPQRQGPDAAPEQSTDTPTQISPETPQQQPPVVDEVASSLSDSEHEQLTSGLIALRVERGAAKRLVEKFPDRVRERIAWWQRRGFDGVRSPGAAVRASIEKPESWPMDSPAAADLSPQQQAEEEERRRKAREAAETLRRRVGENLPAILALIKPGYRESIEHDYPDPEQRIDYVLQHHQDEIARVLRKKKNP